MLTIITNLNDKLQDFKIYDKNVKPWCSGCTEQSRHKHNPCEYDQEIRFVAALFPRFNFG